MPRLILLSLIILPLLTTPALAVEKGLDRVVVIPGSTPEDPGAVLEFLSSWPGFQEATWDTSDSTFKSAVDDSATLSTLELLAGLEATGLEGASLRYEFREVTADKSIASLVSTRNDMRIFLRYNKWSGRMWEFLGKNPYGTQAPLHVQLEILPGANGAAPDTGLVQGFTLAMESDYVQKVIERKRVAARKKAGS